MHVSYKSPVLQQALESTCNPTSSVDHPLPIGQVHIGNRSTHPIHPLRIFKGLIFCKRCGAHSTGQSLHLLATGTCEVRTCGQNSLKRLAQGLKPQGVKTWPAERPDSHFQTDEQVISNLTKLINMQATQIRIEEELNPPSPTPERSPLHTPITPINNSSSDSD